MTDTQREPDGAASAGADESGTAVSLEAQLAAALEESAQRLAAWQRAQADYKNLKKRSQQQIADGVARDTGPLLLDVLRLADDLERALSADTDADTHTDADTDAGNSEAWRDGVRLIQREFGRVLDRAGVQPVAAEGQAFDPRFHEAVGHAPGPAGQVVIQVQKGYLLAGRVLRPAQVMVGTGETPEGLAAPAADADTPHSVDTET